MFTAVTKRLPDFRAEFRKGQVSDGKVTAPPAQEAWQRWMESLRIALDAIFSNRLRSSLTIVGVVIGVAVVALVAALLEGAQTFIADQAAGLGPGIARIEKAAFQDFIGVTVVVLIGSILGSLSAAITNDIESFSPNFIYFTKEERIGPRFRTPTAEERARREISYESVLAVAALDSPVAVSPQKVRGSYGPSADQPKMSARGREAINPLILGVWDNYPEVVAVDLAQGRFFTETERKSRAKVPAWAVVTGLLTSASVGLIAGMYPAVRAAQLDPVVAIRGV